MIDIRPVRMVSIGMCLQSCPGEPQFRCFACWFVWTHVMLIVQRRGEFGKPDLLGRCGLGARNHHGWMLAPLVQLMVSVLTHLRSKQFKDDKWTCSLIFCLILLGAILIKFGKPIARFLNLKTGRQHHQDTTGQRSSIQCSHILAKGPNDETEDNFPDHL